MESSYSPPVLYLTDDDNDDDNLVEQHLIFNNSLKTTINENLPHKKRKLPNNNAQINPSMIPWSKRQRNDHYLQQQQQQISRNLFNSEPETIVIDPDEPIIEESESHSFVAFDWTNDIRPSAPLPAPHLPPRPRIFSNPVQPIPRLAIPSQHTSLMPIIHQNDRYMQSTRNKPVMSFPIASNSSPPLPLPLPTSTSAFTRPSLPRVQATKTIRIPYTHSTPSSPLIVHQFPLTFHPPPSNSIINAPVTPEIRRQALNGNAVLSAFYDSKCYRCNICRFKTVTSSDLLQHLFTHIFFCRQCSYYSYSQHSLYQHAFEKHNSPPKNDNIDPKSLDLLYVTRCQDGTFALCMDSSATKVTAPVPSKIATNEEQQSSNSSTIINNKKPKRKAPKKKKIEQEVLRLPENQPSTSEIKYPISNIEKQAHTYVVMKHRRCFSMKSPLCLHSLTLEYNICREHTLRRMFKKKGILKQQKLVPKLKMPTIIEDVAYCLKAIVNDIVDIEDNMIFSKNSCGSNNLICKLPNNIINSIFPTDDLVSITSSLKLQNKYDKSIEQNDYENSISTNNNPHIFILSASDTNQNEQSIITSLHISVTNSDSDFMQTRLNALPISHDNTARFLKGTTRLIPQTINLTPNPSSNPEQPSNFLPKPSFQRKSSRSIDRNNNAITPPKSKASSVPSVIIID